MRYLILVFFPMLFMGCNIDAYKSSRPSMCSFEDLWETTYQVISRRYYIIRASKKDKEIETEWDQQLSNFYLDGYRNKVFVLIEKYDPEKDKDKEQELPEPGDEDENELEAEEKKTEYVIKLYVKREQNRNIDNPSDPKEAIWLPVPNNEAEEARLLNFINALISNKECDKTAD